MLALFNQLAFAETQARLLSRPLEGCRGESKTKGRPKPSRFATGVAGSSPRLRRSNGSRNNGVTYTLRES